MQMMSCFMSFRFSIYLYIPAEIKGFKTLKSFFQYLSLLNSTGPKDWIWNETVDLQKINFEYQDKIRPQVYVAGLSSELHVNSHSLRC